MTPEIAHLLSTYGYWLMAFGALIEGETFLIAGGIAAHKGYFHLGGLILLAFVGSTIHDCFFFFLGRFGGESFIRKKPQLYEKAERVLDLFEKYGVWLIIALRFAYGLRTIIPMVFGISHISTSKFIFYDMIGGVLWSCVFILGGYFFGAVLDQFMSGFDEYSAYVFYCLAVLAGLAVIAGGTYWFYRARTKKRS